MKKLLVYLVLAVVALWEVPAYAEAVAPEKTLSIIQFSELSENKGLSKRMVDRKYEEYRNFRAPKATLGVESIR